MFRRSALASRIRGSLSEVTSHLRPHRWTLLIVVALLGVTTAAPLIARSLPDRERIVVGNTAGMLTTMLEINGHRVLVGAGPTRSHAADLIGRSTRPWEREIDLLIVPGWDDSHAVGALGLLERRSVSGIAVVGVPGNEPVWTMLERSARAEDIALRYLSSPHHLALGKGIELRMSALEEGSGAWIRLDYNGIRIDLIDATDVAEAAPPVTQFEHWNEHVIVNMRSQRVPDFAKPALMIRPMPFYYDEFQETSAQITEEVDRNEQVRLDLGDGEIRLPLEGDEP